MTTLDKSVQFKNILAIGAHPDDIEYGCLGFLLKQAKNKAQITCYVATQGSVGDPSSGPGRQQESLRALAVLPSAQFHFRQKSGISPQDFDEVLDELYRIIQSSQPDLILTLSSHDTHQEHRYIHEITLAAARRSMASILSYPILSNTLEYSPSLFVDIKSEFAHKKAALSEHKSQRDKYYMSDEYLEIFHSHNYASLHGIRYCEAYEIVRLFS